MPSLCSVAGSIPILSLGKPTNSANVRVVYDTLLGQQLQYSDPQNDRPQRDLMSRAVYPISIVLHALWLLAVSPAVAADPPTDARGDFDRWIPSLALTVGFTTQEHQGTVDSCVLDAAGGSCAGRPAADRRVFNDNQKHFTALQIGGSAELQTPRLLPHEWSPRIFIGGEISYVSAQRRPLAREGNPSKITFDPGAGPFPGNAILGQGSATYSDADTVLYGASIGVSIPVQIGPLTVNKLCI